ncbi:MAG: SpaA isopeptide-forming pilin-related protein, partial [Galactobacillus timonensis]|nr:SpaA isopeptide-forming pilin-related protein [Galactobacillus timonensis]
EDAGQWTARFTAANVTADGTIARTSGENTSENQELATETETVEEGEKTTVTFINTLAFTQQLTVKKTVQHEDGEQINPNEKFEVTVTVTGLKPGARIDTDSVGILTADDTGMAVKTFNMKDQQSVVFRNVPVSATYQVKETGNDYIGSYSIYYGKDHTEIDSGKNDAANEDLNTTGQTMVKDQDPTVELISGVRWVKVAFRKEAEDGTKLHGANFTLYKGTGESKTENNKMSLGEKTLTLASGTYELVETKAPRGYLITDDTATIKFNVNENGVALVNADKLKNMVSIEKEDGKDPVIVIKNKAGTRLPSTGGMDVRILLAAAVAMIGTALFGFWKLKKEEKH